MIQYPRPRFVGCVVALSALIPGFAFAQTALLPVNFGTVAVGSSSPQNIVFTGVPANTSFALYNSAEFSLGPPACAGGNCTLPVTFQPANPGSRSGLITATNPSTGSVVETATVYGVGQGPQIAFSGGVISTVANRATAALSSAVINGVAISSAGNLWVSDEVTNQVYFINPKTGQAVAFAGNGQAGYSGDGGVSTAAKLNLPAGLALDPAGNLFISDAGNNVVRRVDGFSQIITTIAGTGAAGNGGDGGAANLATLNNPAGLAFDSQGNLYIADGGNNRVRKVAAVNGQVTGSSTITSFAGTGTAGFSGDGAAATSAELSQPRGVAVDLSGNVYIADLGNSVVREVSGGTISTVAGVGTQPGYSGDAGPATSALLDLPAGVAVDAGGSIYIADLGSNVIRKVSGDSAHVIFTIAGTSAAGYSGDGGLATSATLRNPNYIAVDQNANVFVDDWANHALREISSAAPPLSFPLTGGTTATVSAYNAGNADLSISGVAASNYSPSVAGNCPGSTLHAGNICLITISAPSGSIATGAEVTVSDNSLNHSTQQTIAISGIAGLHFVPMVPCRAIDTRVNDGYSGTYLVGGSSRGYTLPQSPNCSIPSDAAAYALNVGVVPHGSLEYLTVWPRGQTQPAVSNLNSYDGRIKSNAAVVGADATGGINFYATNDTELVIDVDGYFVASTDANYASRLQFYPITPCRVADTRTANGSLGGPAIAGHTSRDFPVLSSSCGSQIPPNVQAYSFNFTVVPQASQPVIYITAWPTGQTQTSTATANSLTGTVVANAAVIQAGGSGNVSVYASNATDVVIDVNGYFAAPGANGLSFYPVVPCRVFDTRLPGPPVPFAGTVQANFTASSCSVPSGAQAYAIGATAIPESALGFLTLWPYNAAEPLSSTLNANDQSVTSNLSITPTTNGSISAFASSSTNLILDFFGYFAP